MAIESQVPATGKVAILPPGPKGLPVVGPLLELKNDILGTGYRAMLEFGDVVRFAGGPGKFHREAVAVYHPDAVQYVLASGADNYWKGDDAYYEVRVLLGDGLLTSNGDVWKRQKRMIQPLFTHKTIANYVPMIADEGEQLVARFAGASAGGGTIDLGTEMTRLTLRVVGRAVFGAEVDHMIPVFKDRVPYLSKRAFKRSINPFKVPLEWPTVANKVAKARQEAIYGVVDDLVAKLRARPTGGVDLVSLLLAARDPETGEGLSDSEVRDQALVFLLAGHETTATSLTFALHLLGFHPEILQRVHDEAVDVLGDSEPTMETIMGLAYTTQVVKEAMRLYPAAHTIPRVSINPFEYNGYTIPAGENTVVSPWSTHRHPKFWDDPWSFDPERFTPDKEKARHRYAYFPFGGGPRACIGQYFSMLESVLVTAMVARSFTIKTEDRKVPLFTGITLRPEGRMPAQLARR
ncbi:MAG TPA: cytochrome P450 [Actinomycetota bacterium]|nr:cytochrome P450 [Actinomycetota bacterium]